MVCSEINVVVPTKIEKVDPKNNLFIIRLSGSEKNTNDGVWTEKNEDAEKGVKENPNEPADFETAIAACGFGKFNFLLMLCTMPGFWSGVCITSNVSFIFSKARCDLDLSLVDMGYINAIAYTGMIGSAMVWGFLSDTLGRKDIMVFGLMGTAFLEVMISFSQTYQVILGLKFMSGFLSSGPMAIMIAYLSEVHGTHVRAQVMVLTSLFYTMANINLPLLAWAVLPLDINFTLFGGAVVLKSWHIFLMMLTFAPILATIAFSQMPESPKFLMSRGRNEEAMKVFQHIYSKNSGNAPESYPIKVLVDETANEKGSSQPKPQGVEALRRGFHQLSPLFQRPHIFRLMLVSSLYVSCMFGSNTIRLWFPQMSAMIEEYNSRHSEPTSLCAVMAPSTTALNFTLLPLDLERLELAPTAEECLVINTGKDTYINSAIVGGATIFTYIFGGILVNRVGKPHMAAACCGVAAACAAGLPWLPPGVATIVSVVSIYMAFVSLASVAVANAVVDLFPTTLRVMAMAVVLMCGRLGSFTGNVAFPALLKQGCLAPFITISLIMSGGFVLSLLLPKTTLKNME